MGVIRKKAGTRGTEGGLKYICDVCSVDITSTVRIHCADAACPDYDLCVPCFSKGASSRDHNPGTHSFNVIEQHSLPVFTEEWGADEEMQLLEGAEVYGLGSWADIADHIGGYRTKEEVRDHYISTYVDSPNFPLPTRADFNDNSLLEEVPREVFQARKKRRIEDCKEAAKNAPLAAPKQKPTSSVPSCHEVQGYMPGRLEFEIEYHNEAEEAVQHMQFEPGDGVKNAHTGELEPEMELKMVIMDIYNSKLTARAQRKKSIFEHALLEYRKNTALDKKRSKEERELFARIKPFVRTVNHADFLDFWQGLEYEHNLRQAIAQLQDWRAHAIGDLRTGERYETEKAQRAATRPTGMGLYDRQPGIKPGKPLPPAETPGAIIALTAPELPERLKSSLRPAGAAAAVEEAAARSAANSNNNSTKQPLSEGTPNAGAGSGLSGLSLPRSHYSPTPVPGTAPLKLTPENASDLHLLTGEEKELCSSLRIMPKAYLVMKEALLREAVKAGGGLKKKTAREICRIDPAKGQKVWEFMVRGGWIGRA